MGNFLASIDIWGCLGMIMIGIAILITTCSFLQYAKKKMSDSFGMIWLLISIVMFVMGIALIIAGYNYTLVCAVASSIFALLLLLIFVLSRMVSDLMMKVRELAMQVALLNQENDNMLQQINRLREQGKDV